MVWLEECSVEVALSSMKFHAIKENWCLYLIETMQCEMADSGKLFGRRLIISPKIKKRSFLIDLSLSIVHIIYIRKSVLCKYQSK